MSNQKKAKGYQIKMKGEREFRHDLFKLGVAEFKKNTSFVKGKPKIQDVEHVHYFHNVDSRGKVQDRSNEVGGHFHKVKIVEHSDGSVSAECGPPMKRIKVGKPGEKRTKVVPVKWEKGMDVDEDGNETATYEQDKHTHEIEYVHSEVLTPDKIKQTRQNNAAGIIPDKSEGLGL